MTIQSLHDSSWRGVLYFTGGGSYALSDLLTEPGASGTVLEASVPYSQKSMRELLKSEVDSYCSKGTACMLAMQAYQRSRSLADSEELFGLACTASLRSSNPKRGPHRAHIALQTPQKTIHWELDFQKGELSRDGEERRLADVVVSSLLSGLDVAEDSTLAPADLEVATSDLSDLLLDRRGHVNKSANAFLPGSFNPLHRGHRMMKQIAEKTLGCEVQYELCIHNVDKPTLNYIELRNRLKQFAPGEYVLTNAPKFVDKAAALNNDSSATFVVGVDTLKRIVSPTYYRDQVTLRDDSIKELLHLGTEFLVFGRVDKGNFVTLDDIEIPSELKPRCRGISETDFRDDISSTELRHTGNV